jgi:hypothetical protein
MLYHQVQDAYYVKQFLGHKELRNTEIYINIEQTLFEPGSDAFSVKVAEKHAVAISFAVESVLFACTPRWQECSMPSGGLETSHRFYSV